jgi:hypothetical protein
VPTVSELQLIVDKLAADLAAPAVLEDGQQRTIVYSAQNEPVDDVRRNSILRRETAPEIVEWFKQFGISGATEPIWIPGQPELRVLGRVCAPVRYRDQLLGFLWLLDDARSVWEDPHALARMRTDCGHIAQLLYEEHLADRLRGEVLGHLLSPSAELRASAVSMISDRALWPRGAPVAAVVVTAAPARGSVRDDNSDAVRRALVDALADLGAEPLCTGSLRAALADHVVLLIRSRRSGEDRAGAVADRARSVVTRRLAECAEGTPLTAAVGIGECQTTLSEAHVSYRQARLAAKVAEVIATPGGCWRWRDLGVFRTLAQLPSWGVRDLELDPRFVAVLDGCDPEILHTLETYLELGCDVRRTAAELHVHRHTLYYRLQKVERLAGVNLRDGNDRLVVHLGFKMARLAGIYPR